MQSSIISSAGAQHTITETLGWSLDLNEPDRPAPLNFNSIELQLSSPSASAEGGSSTGHPRTEDPRGRKLVSGGSQMDCGSARENPVIRSEPTGNRFNII